MLIQPILSGAAAAAAAAAATTAITTSSRNVLHISILSPLHLTPSIKSPMKRNKQSLTLLSSPSPNNHNNHNHNNKMIQITSLARYAIKGLSSPHNNNNNNKIQTVYISEAGETFPDDRRFGLLKKPELFDENDPKWIHKEYFVCAFTEPVLLARYSSDYGIVRVGGVDEEEEEEFSRVEPLDCSVSNQDDGDGGGGGVVVVKRMLSVWDTEIISPPPSSSSSNDEDDDDPWKSRKQRRRIGTKPLLGPTDLSTQKGRDEVSRFFSKISGQDVICVTKASSSGEKKEQEQEQKHTHQFGNTRSGVKARNDTRTIHIVNAATVRELGDRIGMPLHASRFRPNVVIDGVEAWEEFGWVGKELHVVVRDGKKGKKGIVMDVLQRTVRCDGIGVDPEDPEGGVLDIPKLLMEHYPEHGPYFGIYCVVKEGGCISIGDELVVVDKEEG